MLQLSLEVSSSTFRRFAKLQISNLQRLYLVTYFAIVHLMIGNQILQFEKSHSIIRAHCLYVSKYYQLQSIIFFRAVCYLSMICAFFTFTWKLTVCVREKSGMKSGKFSMICRAFRCGLSRIHDNVQLTSTFGDESQFFTTVRRWYH